MSNFFENLNNLFSTWAKGLQDSQKQNQQNQGAGTSAPSFESVGNTLLGGIGDAVSSAWTGFLNKAQESNKQNIQAGNYTTNPETVHLESPFGNHDNLAQRATAEIQQGNQQYQIEPWKSKNPFQIDEVDKEFEDFVYELYDLNPNTSRSIKRDAYELFSSYVNDVFASNDLGVKSPKGALKESKEEAKDRLRGLYTGEGKSGKEIEGLLQAQEGWQTEKQHRESQEKNVISAAMAKQNGDAPYSRLAKLTGDALEGKAGENTAREISQALEELGDAGRQAMEFVSHLPYTQAMGYLNEMANENLKMSYEEADKYLREANPMYSLAKDTQGQMDDYAAAYGDLAGLYRRGAEGGYDAMTPAEQYAYHDLSGAEGFEWLFDPEIMENPAGLSEDQLRQITDFGQTRAQQMEEAKGLFSPYEMTPYQQGLWEQYVNTPEGAAQWAEDAKGTKDEEKARDNLWLVTRETKYAERAAMPNFAEMGKAKSDFHSEDQGFEQKYRVINNIDGAAEAAGLLADVGGSSSYAVSLYHFMTPKEKEIFNSYANEGAIDEANKFLDYLSYAINERMTKEGAERMQAMGESGWGGGLIASGVSVPLSVARGVGYLDTLVQNAANWVAGLLGGEQKPVDRYSAAQLPGTLADSARQGVMNQVDWNVNILGRDVDVFDFLYSTGMSGLDSLAAGKLGAALGGLANSAEKAKMIAEWTGAAVLGTGAAQSAMQEAYDQGGNNGTALLMGLAAGINETLFEKISIGNLIENGKKIGKAALGEQIKQALVEAGVNGSEEFFTSIGNGIADCLIRGNESDVKQKANEYERLGMNPDAALAKAQGDFWASAVMDGVGGALMGLGFGAAENAQSSQYTRQVDTAVGGGFSKEAVESLVSLAKDAAQKWTEARETSQAAYADAKAKAKAAKGKEAKREAKQDVKGLKMAQLQKADRIAELAGKIDPGKPKARQVGELFRLLSETQGKEARGTMRNIVEADVALQLAKETGAMDPAAAEAITDMMEGANLTPEQVEAIAQNKAALAIVDALFSGENENGDTSSGAGAAPSPQGEGLEPVQFEPMPGMEMPGPVAPHQSRAATASPARGSLLDAPKINVQTVIGQDKSGAAQRIESITEDECGGVRVKLEDGQNVDLEDAGLSAPMQEAARIAAGQDQAKAAALMNAAQEALGKGNEGGDSSLSLRDAQNDSEAGKASGETDKASARLAADVAAGRDFALGFSAVYDAAAKGLTREQVRTVYGEQLQEDVREKAYEAGRQAYERAEAQAEERNVQEAQAAGYRTVKNAGADAVGVLFDRVRDGIKQGGERVNAMLQMLDRVGREFGMQYRVVDKLENDANGKYVHGTNIVYLSLDAEEGAITKAASHEGFHFISAFSPEMKKTITDFVLDKLGKVEGYDLERRIQEVRQQYRDGAGQELEQGEDRYHDGAIEEIVADSMLDVIGTRENMEQLMKQSKSTAEKIKEWITNTYQKFKAILNRLARNSPEVAALKDDVDYLGRISSMWQEGMRQAAEAWRQAQVGYNDGSAALEQNQAVQQYRQEMQGDMTVDDRENSLTAFLAQLFMDTQGPWIQANMDAYEEGLEKYRQALLEYKRGGVALNVALERAGLSPLSGNDIRVASYAADQVMTQEGAKERAKARAEENAETNTGGGESYSLKTLPDGQKYVEVDTDQDIFEGQPESRFGAIARNYIKEHFRNTVIGEVNRAYVRRDSENEYTNPADHNMPQDIYNNKMQAVTELPNLLDAGRFIGEKDDDGRHGPDKRHKMKVEKWLNYDVIYKVGDRWFEGETKIARIARGTLFHDITQIKDVTQQILTDYAIAQHQTENVSNNSISNSGGKVNEKFSLPTQRRQEADAAEWVRDDAELYAQLKQDPDARAALWMIERIYRNTTTGEGRTVLSEADLNKRLPEVVKRLKEQTGATVSDKTMTWQIMRLWKALQKPGYQMGEMMQYARNMIKRWIESAPGVMAEQDETTKEILQELKHPFSLTPDMKSEIKGTFGDARDFYRKNIGKMRIKNDAKSTLADVWMETLNKLNPGVFAADATEADMPIILDAWLETAGRREVSGEFGANIGAMSTDLAMNTILELFNTPDILQTRYEMNKARVDRTYQLYQAAERLVATVREGYKQKYQERIERDRQTKAEREEKQGWINRIKESVKPIKTMVIRGTDNRHVPEAMRGAAERMLDILGNDRAIFSGQEAREIYMKFARLGEDGQLHDVEQASAYDPDIVKKLEALADKYMNGRALRNMTVQELEDIYDIVNNFKKLVDYKNQKEVNGRRWNERDLAEHIMQEMKDKKAASDNPVLAFLRKVGFKEMTPVYYAKQVGGTLGDLINDIIRSESDVAFIIKDAKAAFDKAAEKYHLNEWIHDKNHLRFQTDAGDTIELTREQAMTLYAWAEREKRNKTQSAAHLRRGGFTYDRNDKDVKLMKGVNFTKSHVLSVGDLAQIRNYLTDEQRGFVETMVKYLSENMAEKGNEASMRMFGWKKFGEKWYFPYPTDRNFRGKNSTDAKGQPDKQIKYMGSSHALTEKAMNPLKLGNFTDIWAGHVDEMARYSVMAEKLDNLQRVTNYVVAGSEKVDNETGVEDVIAPESVKKEIERALGQEGAHYLEQFLRDINGNNRSDERGLSDKWISLFKKGSVAANLSVVLQQPSAFVRAMSMVKPRYFGMGLFNPLKFKKIRERMYKNSGVANLKQWGGFDTNTGSGFQSTLLDSLKADSKIDRAMDFVDKWTGKGAEKADEITWVYMYSAIEAEIDDRTDYRRGTEEFDQAVAMRFDEVMRFTQVYDSAFAKSEWMRSTSTMDKIATSFMAEPTLWINMMMDAGLDVNAKKPGAGKKAARALGVFVAGTFVNSLLQSVATAFRRKKEEGTTWIEKYLSELQGNFEDALSLEGIAGMIPLARDVVSLFQGYDVERADMAVIGNMIDACRKILTHDMMHGDWPDLDEWMNLAGMAGNMFGVPVRNLYRDLSGIYANTFGGASRPLSETSMRSLKYTALDNTSWLSFFNPWDASNAAYYDRMEQALIKGDMKQYEELRGYMEETKLVKPDSIDKEIKKEIKESVLGGLISDEKAMDMLKNHFGMDQQKAYYTVDSWQQTEKNKDTENYSYSREGALMAAVKAGQDVKEEMKKLTDNGYTEKELKSDMKSQIGKWYRSGEMTRQEAESKLQKYTGETDRDNMYWLFDKWDYMRKNGSDEGYGKYNALYELIDTGRDMRQEVQRIVSHGVKPESVSSAITAKYKETYVSLYRSGKTAEAANLKAKLLNALEAAGLNRETKNKAIEYWLKDKQ